MTPTSTRAHRNIRTAPHATPNGGQAYRLVSAAAALVLATAAVLKAAELTTSPLVSSRSSTAAQVAAEWLLAAWLFSGLYPLASWIAAVFCFAMFAAVSGFFAWRGQASCGCFGTVHVHPLITMSLDLFLLILLLAVRPLSNRGSAPKPVRFFVWSAAAALTCGAGVWLMFHPYISHLQPDGSISGSAQAVLLEPRQWVGSDLPLLKHLDVAEKLRQGRWQVLFYDGTCPECRQMLQRLTELAAAAARTLAKEQLAVVQLTPDPAGLPASAQPAQLLLGHLSGERTWYIAPSTLIHLVDGKVQKIAEGPQFDKRLIALATAHPLLVRASQSGEFVAELGLVKPDSLRAIRFLLNNPTDAAMEIRGVASDCACASIYRRPQLIAPHGTAELDVLFHAPSEPMMYSKGLTVRTGDSARTFRLQIAARVGLPLRIQPQELDLGLLGPNGTALGHIEVLNEGADPARLLYGTSADPSCLASVPSHALAPGASVLLPVKVWRGTKPTGCYTTALQVTTSLAFQPSLQFTVRYRVP